MNPLYVVIYIFKTVKMTGSADSFSYPVLDNEILFRYNRWYLKL